MLHIGKVLGVVARALAVETRSRRTRAMTSRRGLKKLHGRSSCATCSRPGQSRRFTRNLSATMQIDGASKTHSKLVAMQKSDGGPRCRRDEDVGSEGDQEKKIR